MMLPLTRSPTFVTLPPLPSPPLPRSLACSFVLCIAAVPYGAEHPEQSRMMDGWLGRLIADDAYLVD